MVASQVIDPRPYMQIAAALRAQIAGGTLSPGDKVPSLTALSTRHGWHRQTRARASGTDAARLAGWSPAL